MAPSRSDLEEVIIRVDEALKGSGGVLDKLAKLECTVKKLDDTLDATTAKLEQANQTAELAYAEACKASEKVSRLSSKFWLVVGALAGSGILTGGIAALINAVG